MPSFKCKAFLFSTFVILLCYEVLPTMQIPPDCIQDSDCSPGTYCCYVDWTAAPVKKCKPSCIGDNCYEDSDCGKDEHCNQRLQCE